jgi:hypothetical protein
VFTRGLNLPRGRARELVRDSRDREYLNAPKWSGKSLVPDPERATLVRQMFEEYATGRFTKQEA